MVAIAIDQFEGAIEPLGPRDKPEDTLSFFGSARSKCRAIFFRQEIIL